MSQLIMVNTIQRSLMGDVSSDQCSDVDIASDPTAKIHGFADQNPTIIGS
jgi:hypothetical protein